jgi:hypothetical protein
MSGSDGVPTPGMTTAKPLTSAIGPTIVEPGTALPWRLTGKGKSVRALRSVTMPDGEVREVECCVADHIKRDDALYIVHAANLFPELVEALEFYADRKSWHWNGAAWEWNGAGSDQYRGDPTARAHQYPAQECVDAECGSVARTTIAKAKARGGAE